MAKMMRRFFLLVSFAGISLTGMAQNDIASTAKEENTVNDSITLSEVEVEAARVVNKADGKLYYPSKVQIANSHSGFSLLQKLTLPNILVDQISHTIAARDNRGEVQVRINGAKANMNDVEALDVASVVSVDYINTPGVRYGKDIAYVINIRTRRMGGGSVGVDLMNALTTKRGRNDVFASYNKGKSQWNIFYEQGYGHYSGNSYHEEADYLLADGTHHSITREQPNNKSWRYSNTMELKYNLADSASYVFQATLAADINNAPRTTDEVLISEQKGDQAENQYSATKSSKSHDITPSLDLYFHHTIGSHQSFTADALGTFIRTKSDSYYDEGTPYTYQVDGKTYSLIGEAIYENSLKPFSLSTGVHFCLKHNDNKYLGDAESINNIHTSDIYGFAQIKGGIAHLNYMVGFGLSNQHYRQGENKYNYLLARPKLTLTYSFTDALQLRYYFELSQHVSQVAMTSDTRIRQNSMEWTVGNPNLKPTSCYENALTLSYAKPRISTDSSLNYRINRRCNLAKYTRTEDDEFLYTQANQPHCNMLYLNNYTTFNIIADHLSLAIEAGIYRFFNKGDDYNHLYTACNYGASLQAYWGRWQVMAMADNGWNFMEGENIGHNAPNLQASVGYSIGDFTLTLMAQNLFLSNPKTSSAELVNKFVHKDVYSRSKAAGNLVLLSVAWRFNHGKQYRDIQRKIKNRDSDKGILK